MTFKMGPLALPGGLLITFAAVLLALMVGNYIVGRRGDKVEAALWWILAGTVIVARLAFVLGYWSLYAEEPWRLADLRDGGMDPAAGLVAAVLIGSLLAWRKRELRHAILSGVAAGVFVWVAGTAWLEEQAPRQPLPQVTLQDLSGRPVALREFAGKPVVVNLWASWCPPCRREMPVLEKAQQGASDVQFVFANQGEDAATVRAYLQAEKLRLRNVLLDVGGMLPALTGSPGLPTTLFFDGNGNLVGQRMGELSPATLAAQLQAIRGSGGALVPASSPGALQ